MSIPTGPEADQPPPAIAAAVSSAVLAARPARAAGGQPSPAIVLVEVDAKGVE